jgi:hypothetical protein
MCSFGWLFAMLPGRQVVLSSQLTCLYLVSLCWLHGTSVLKIDDFALDLRIFLGVQCLMGNRTLHWLDSETFPLASRTLFETIGKASFDRARFAENFPIETDLLSSMVRSCVRQAKSDETPKEYHVE